jgi:PilZ domain
MSSQIPGLERLGHLPYVVLAFLGTMRSLVERSGMQPNSQERRMMRRFDMRLPATVRLEGASEFHTETQNVSARGVFFYLDRAVDAGTKLEVTLTFPPHVTLTDAVRVRFTARVIRVEHRLPSARIGTAAMIEDYEFLRSNGSPDFLAALQSEWKASN